MRGLSKAAGLALLASLSLLFSACEPSVPASSGHQSTDPFATVPPRTNSAVPSLANGPTSSIASLPPQSTYESPFGYSLRLPDAFDGMTPKRYSKDGYFSERWELASNGETFDIGGGPYEGAVDEPSLWSFAVNQMSMTGDGSDLSREWRHLALGRVLLLSVAIPNHRIERAYFFRPSGLLWTAQLNDGVRPELVAILESLSIHGEKTQ